MEIFPRAGDGIHNIWNGFRGKVPNFRCRKEWYLQNNLQLQFLAGLKAYALARCPQPLLRGQQSYS